MRARVGSTEMGAEVCALAERQRQEGAAERSVGRVCVGQEGAEMWGKVWWCALWATTVGGSSLVCGSGGCDVGQCAAVARNVRRTWGQHVHCCSCCRKVGAGAAGCVSAALNGGRWMLCVGAVCVVGQLQQGVSAQRCPGDWGQVDALCRRSLRCGGRGARAGRAPAILCLWLGFRLGFRLPGLCLWGAGACAVWCHCRVLRITFGGGHVSKCCLDISVWFEFTPVWRARAWVFVGRCAGRRGVVDLGAAEPFRLGLWLWLGLFLW